MTVPFFTEDFVIKGKKKAWWFNMDAGGLDTTPESLLNLEQQSSK